MSEQDRAAARILAAPDHAGPDDVTIDVWEDDARRGHVHYDRPAVRVDAVVSLDPPRVHAVEHPRAAAATIAELVARVTSGTPGQIDQAVDDAASAHPALSSLTAAARRRVILVAGAEALGLIDVDGDGAPDTPAARGRARLADAGLAPPEEP